MKVSRVIFLLVFLAFGSVDAQYILEGYVKDSLSGAPLTGASLYIPAQSVGTVTDTAGYYRLRSRYDTLTLEVRLMGYKPLRKFVRLQSPRTRLDILMHEQVFNLTEVLISTPFATLQKDNVMKVNLRMTSDMRKRGVTGLAGGLGQIPGVRLMNDVSAFAKPVIRGLSGNRILIYNNDIRYDNYQFGAKHGLDLSAEGVRSVEVIKGPASLLYGSDALGGIVYLVPEKFAPVGQSRGEVYGQFSGNNLHAHGGMALKSGIDSLRYLFRLTWDKAADYRIPGGRYVLNSRFEANDVKAGLAYRKGRHQWEWRYNEHHARNGIYKGESDTASTQFLSPYQATRGRMLTLKDKWTRGRNFWNVKLGYNGFRRALIQNGAPSIDMYLHAYSADIKRHIRHKRLYIIGGTQWLFKQNRNAGKHYLLPDATEASAGLFVTFQYRTLSGWAYQAGLRGDANRIVTCRDPEHPLAIRRRSFSLTGSAGLKKSWNDRWYLRLYSAKGFRAPNLAELTSNGLHAGRIEIGNPHLKNEENFQIDVDGEWKSDHVEFYSDFYYNRIFNYIFLAPPGRYQNDFPVYIYDQADAYLYGNETGVHIHPHPWDFLHIEASYETARGCKRHDEALPLMPPDKWTLHLRLSLNRNKPLDKPHWNLGIRGAFYDAYVRRAPGEPFLPAYWLWHAYVNFRVKTGKTSWFVYLNGDNLTDTYYIPALSAYRDKQIPGPGRRMTAGIRCSF